MSSIKESPCTRCVRGKRPMHQSTLTLGDQTKCFYSTTHSESFSGRGRGGQPLVFLPREPCYPTQHDGKLDLKNIPVTQGQTHSRDVHGLKEVVPHYVLHQAGVQNRAQNREGVVMKELTNPTEATQYQTTYQTERFSTSSRYQTNEASGQPVSWHCHDIITGEEKAAAGPERPRRRSGESVLWATRRWETSYDSLRLY